MKNRIVYWLTVVAFLAMASCNDWLDVKPETEKDTDEMFDEYQGFKDALTACYIKLNSRSLYGEHMIISSVEFLAQYWDYDASTYSEAEAFKKFEYMNESVRLRVKEIYAAYYNTIIQANTVLQNMETKGETVIKDTATRAVITGEAYAIRAFCHLDVLRLFGQVPDGLRQVQLPYSEGVSIDPVKYYSYDEFKGKIESDLRNAELLLKDNDPIFKYSFTQLNGQGANPARLDDDFMMYRRFRFNYYGVKALQARYYRYIGKDKEAYDAAKSVIDALNIDGTPLLTLSGTGELSTKNYALPSECVVALSNFQLEDYMNDLIDVTKSNGIYLSSVKLVEQLFAGQPTSSHNRYNYVWDINRIDNYGNKKPVIRKYYQDPDDSSAPNVLATQKQVVPLLRLSEMFLIAMESTTSLDEANEMYITYMAARNVPATGFSGKELLNEELVDEYRRELIGEGQMFFTYKRLKRSKMLWGARSVEEQDYIVPLPDTEYNPGL